MKITYLGVELHRAEQCDLPDILRWRNQPKVRQFMQYQSIISIEDHQSWFDRLHNQTNFYFILKKNELPGGILQLSEIDYHRRSAEAGILIGEPFFLGNYLPWLGSYTLLRFAFDLLRLDQLSATVCEENVIAKVYNQSFGFRKKERHTNGFSRYTISRVAWRASTRPYKHLLKRLGAQQMSIHFESKKHKDRAARRLIRERRASISSVALGQAAYVGAERGSDLEPTSGIGAQARRLHRVVARP